MPALIFLLFFISGVTLLLLSLDILSRLSLLLTYILVWTPAERKRYCPKGLFKALCE
jgi:hypothetical protein